MLQEPVWRLLQELVLQWLPEQVSRLSRVLGLVKLQARKIELVLEQLPVSRSSQELVEQLLQVQVWP